MFAPEDRWVVIGAGLGTGMGYVGLSSLVVALPQVQVDLAVDGAGLLWITNIYQLMLASLLIVGGSLGDVIGHRRAYVLGILVFTLGSGASGLAGNLAVMLGARAIQGIGGALMIPGALAVLTGHFSDEKRHRAIGLYSVLAISMSLIGPVLGGFLASSGYWRGVFFINIPFAILTLFCVSRFTPTRTITRSLQKVDWVGALLLTVSLGAMVYSFIEIGQSGITTFTALLVVAGGAGIAVFVWWEQHFPAPMVPLYLFRSPLFRATNIAQFLLYMAMEAIIYFFSLNLIQIQGYSELQTGLAALPYVISLILMSFIVAYVGEHVAAGRLVAVGALMVGIGIVLMTRIGLTTGVDAYWSTYFIPILLIGSGIGVTIVPLDTTMMSSVPDDNVGSASGIDNANVRVASLFAIAVLGGIGLSAYSQALTGRTSDLGLTPDVSIALQQQANELGNASVPTNAPESLVAPIQLAIRMAFVDMFHVIAWASALLAFLGAGVAWVAMRGDSATSRQILETIRQQEAISEIEIL
ncbi:MAG: MFS transporter [Chloroflexota bacterium]